MKRDAIETLRDIKTLRARCFQALRRAAYLSARARRVCEEARNIRLRQGEPLAIVKSDADPYSLTALRAAFPFDR